jgi:hypothetical protein
MNAFHFYALHVCIAKSIENITKAMMFAVATTA